MRAEAKPKATVAKGTSAKSPSTAKAHVVSEAKLGRTALRSPSVIADGNADAVGNQALACVRVNAGDCDGGSATPNQGPGPANQVVPVITGDATATAANLADGAACLRINGGTCDATDGDGSGGGTDPASSALPRSSVTATVVSNPRLGRTALRSPSVIADGNADAVGNQALACVRVNAGDCDGGSATPNQGSGPANQVVPVITGDATATAANLADGAACLRINGGTCDATDGDGSGGGTDPASSALPRSSVTATVVSNPRLGRTALRSPSVIADGNADAVGNQALACVRVNAGDCDGGSATPTQGPGPANQVVPVITGDATATAANLADGTVCLRINGGSCGDTNQGSDDSGGTDNTIVGRADTSVDASLPTLGSADTPTARGVLGICLRLGGGSCTGGGVDGSGGGGTGGPLGRGPSGRGDGRIDSDGNGSGRSGSIDGGFFLDFDGGVAADTVGFGDRFGVGDNHLGGGDVRLVTSRLTLDPAVRRFAVGPHGQRGGLAVAAGRRAAGDADVGSDAGAAFAPIVRTPTRCPRRG